jgi:putative hemolysin
MQKTAQAVSEGFRVRLAASEADLRAAQRLRYDVFVEELGGGGALVDHAQRLERDRFDPFFDHLLLEDVVQARVVGVYRLMRQEQAARAGAFYSATEYDLSPLLRSGKRLLELGRSCLHPAYRGGAGLHILWQGLAEYVVRHRIDILFGVASFHGTDPHALAEPLSLLHHRHLAPEHLRAKARAPGAHEMDLIPPQELDRRRAMLAVPGLIKAYLRLGGMVGEGAFVDRTFNTTDVCLILDTSLMDERQSRSFRGTGG